MCDILFDSLSFIKSENRTTFSINSVLFVQLFEKLLIWTINFNSRRLFPIRKRGWNLNIEIFSIIEQSINLRCPLVGSNNRTKRLKLAFWSSIFNSSVVLMNHKYLFSMNTRSRSDGSRKISSKPRRKLDSFTLLEFPSVFLDISWLNGYSRLKTQRASIWIHEKRKRS